MKSAHCLSTGPGNKLASYVCLMAVLLLWAPLWAAAFSASGLACCDGVVCPLHGHAPKKSSHDANSAKDAPMTPCERHAHNAAMDCTMACCHPANPAVTTTVVFVLPASPVISGPAILGPPPPNWSDAANSAIFEPPYPPPRTSVQRNS